jgi:hypothetical protein
MDEWNDRITAMKDALLADGFPAAAAIVCLAGVAINMERDRGLRLMSALSDVAGRHLDEAIEAGRERVRRN